MRLLSTHIPKLAMISSEADKELSNDPDRIRKIILTKYIRSDLSKYKDLPNDINEGCVTIMDDYLQNGNRSEPLTALYSCFIGSKELFTIEWNDKVNQESFKYIVKNAKTLEGFAGMMVYYCPKRYVFLEI